LSTAGEETSIAAHFSAMGMGPQRKKAALLADSHAVNTTESSSKEAELKQSEFEKTLQI